MHRSLSACSTALALCLLATLASAQTVPAAVEDVPFEKLAKPVATTTGPFGYQPATVDKNMLLQMLRSGSYTQLDFSFDGLQRATEQDIRHEYVFLDAMRAFHIGDSTLPAPLVAWKEAIPHSAHAHAAMTTWYLARAGAITCGPLRM